ncbi:MAG: glycoside hydrolase family 13 protein [Clostridia bacterium]|nr:glycoside hydrolase family 13 protein [Clostridia bacterium]
MYYPFDSRKALYKSKFGAVASGESLTLRLILHNDARVNEAFLRFHRDDLPYVSEVKLTAGDYIDDYRIYYCDISFDTGLYFYSFRYTSKYGEFFVTTFENNVGVVASDGKWWQLTCYDKDYKTPDWLSGGLIYQIFPDRFNFSGKPKKNIPSDRYIVKDLNKQPEYKQNNGPCSLGNDYYGGDLEGITQKLPYLADLGVTCIYLNPIFEAHSNHRYNTADYLKIDPLLGDEDDLVYLCKSAEKYGISVILDGVFSHTGDDSIYFNKYKRYGDGGAYNDTNSPYYSWYKFYDDKKNYHAWWGVPSLPEIIEENEQFNDFINGENGVIRYWLKRGIRGWRLDVADELPDCFLDNIRAALKAEKEDGYLLGEVWEDATTKESYGSRRRYLHGAQLDSVMNYPFANAIISYVNGGDGKDLLECVLNILENYPPESIKLLMNHLGTHDTARLITRLGKGSNLPHNRSEQAEVKLSGEEIKTAIKKQKLAAVIQYTLPGVPSLFYGDEAGIEGCGDPFCRVSFPWGNENKELLEFYKWLGNMRKSESVFKNGSFEPVLGGLGILSYIRFKGNEKLLVAVNRWCEDDQMELPDEFKNAKALYGNPSEDGILKIPAMSFAILKTEE